jgi:hypothetical protein
VMAIAHTGELVTDHTFISLFLPKTDHTFISLS